MLKDKVFEYLSKNHLNSDSEFALRCISNNFKELSNIEIVIAYTEWREWAMKDKEVWKSTYVVSEKAYSKRKPTRKNVFSLTPTTYNEYLQYYADKKKIPLSKIKKTAEMIRKGEKRRTICEETNLSGAFVSSLREMLIFKGFMDSKFTRGGNSAKVS